MSIYHVNQIKNHLEQTFNGFIDMSDVGLKDRDRSSKFLSRALAAYAIQYIASISSELAGASVTDGGDDRCLDTVR